MMEVVGDEGDGPEWPARLGEAGRPVTAAQEASVYPSRASAACISAMDYLLH